MKRLLIFLSILFSLRCEKAAVFTDSSALDLKEEICLNPKNLMVVSTPSGVNLRRTPNIHSEVLSLIPESETVCKIEETKIPLKTEDGEGVFLKIEYGGNVGFAFSLYLVPFQTKNNNLCKSPGGIRKYNENRSKFALYRSSKTDQVDVGNCNDHYGYSCSIAICGSDASLLFYLEELPQKFYYIERIEKWIDEDTVLTISDFGDGGDSAIAKGVYSLKKKAFLWETLLQKHEEDRSVLNEARLVGCYHQKCYFGKFEKGSFSLYKAPDIRAMNQFNYYAFIPDAKNRIFNRQKLKNIEILENTSGLFLQFDGEKYSIDTKKDEISPWNKP